MTDKELMGFAEKVQYFRKSPSAFAEYLYGAKLHWYQKFMLDNIESLKSYPRKPMRKWNTYISLCCAYIEMKDDDYIASASPKKVERLSKSEFLEYLENYWGDGDK